jgi:hypothetical protein
MRYGYTIFPADGDNTFKHHVKDHCTVLSATLNMVLWNLCRQDTLVNFFDKAFIFDADTETVLYTIRPDEKIKNLERQRNENREKWESVSTQLSRDDWKNKTPLYKKLSPQLNTFKKNDETIVAKVAERVEEIRKTLQG